jgi:integrase
MARMSPMIDDLVGSYLAVRRAAGYVLKNDENHLTGFARFADARRDEHIKSSTAEGWAKLARSPAQRERRLQAVIRLAAYARKEDDRHEVPRRNSFSRSTHRRPTPFIFTEKQIRRLLDAVDKLPPPGSRRSSTYQTLFGLLAATGLRISEALALTVNDLTKDGLVIRLTKFRKSRLVPLHPSVRAAVVEHLRSRAARASDAVFVNDAGEAIRYSHVEYAFRRALRAAGIERRPGQPRPRIHSLRHTFAVRALETCPHDPARIAHHMVALATYLGHAHLSSTYWYLQATPKVMGDIADACDALVRDGGTQ